HDDVPGSRYGVAGFHRSGALLDLRHQRDTAEARRRETSHHAHHCTVIHLPVATHIDALILAAALARHGLQLGHQPVALDLGILQPDLALGVYRYRHLHLVLVERL